MSTKRTYNIESHSMVIIKTISTSELHELETSLLEMIQEKVSKISHHLSSSHVTYSDSILVVHDELGINSDITEIMNAYGYRVHHIQEQSNVSSKGKMYVITDELIQMYHLIQADSKKLEKVMSIFNHQSLDLSKSLKFINFKSKEIQSLLQDHQDLKNSQHFHQVINSIRNNQEIKIEKTDLTNVTEYDGRIISKRLISSSSEQSQFDRVTDQFKKLILEMNKNHQSNVVHGTTKSLEVRAKKLGYIVSKKQTGDNIQLVLVRGR